MTDYKHILIDGDIIICKAAFAAQTVSYEVSQGGLEGTSVFAYKREATALVKEFPEAIIERKVDAMPEPIVETMIDGLLTKIKTTLQCDSSRVIIGPPSGTKTFRHEAAVSYPYKGNRVDPWCESAESNPTSWRIRTSATSSPFVSFKNRMSGCCAT